MLDGKSPVTALHLVMTVGQKLHELNKSIYENYTIKIDMSSVRDTEVFLGTDGLPTLQVIRRDTGAVIWEFKFRKIGKHEEDLRSYIDNPKAFLYPDVIKNFSVFINTARELDILNDVKIDVRVDSGFGQGRISYQLMTLLNNYSIGDGWSCNPGPTRTTAYFILRYLGTGADAPDVYKFNRETERMAVVDLLVDGQYKTHAIVVG